MRRLRAIDVYSGVGGWSLGLAMAGIEVVASFDIWERANETNRLNNHHPANKIDVRKICLSSLPKNIDLIVGSPPCTQFSYANRGGSGDIGDGIEDLKAFIRLVKHLQPRAWVMENVPRVADVVQKEIIRGGSLYAYREMFDNVEIFELEKFGLPQRRERCLVGNIDFDLLRSYTRFCKRRTLGSVLKALARDVVTDPIYGQKVDRELIIDHMIEEPLNQEELRINRSNKQLHPVYNGMPFPEDEKRAVRTVTATCTRVSRESIIVEDAKTPGAMRRLSIRECASLQSFPIDFQFYGLSYGQKRMMIGNAMPPLFAFYVGHACKATSSAALPALKDAIKAFAAPEQLPPITVPEQRVQRYRESRGFRFAIPSLRLKSGVRFELANNVGGQVEWSVNFYFGSPKNIRQIALTRSLMTNVMRVFPKDVSVAVRQKLNVLTQYVASADTAHMQMLWAHRGPGLTRPFDFLDALDQSGNSIVGILHPHPIACSRAVDIALASGCGTEGDASTGVAKLHRNASTVVAGILVGAITNSELANKGQRSADAGWGLAGNTSKKTSASRQSKRSRYA